MGEEPETEAYEGLGEKGHSKGETDSDRHRNCISLQTKKYTLFASLT
jgi:hypothetical protein